MQKEIVSQVDQRMCSLIIIMVTLCRDRKLSLTDISGGAQRMRSYINFQEQTKKMRGRRTKEIPAVSIRRYRPVKLPEET